jgi:hypothetical protein
VIDIPEPAPLQVTEIPTDFEGMPRLRSGHRRWLG